MAENEDGQEKTEDATPRRQEDAAKKGQIARSRELTTLTMLLVAAGGLLMLGSGLIEGLAEQMRAGLAMDARKMTDPGQISAVLGQMIADWVLLQAPLLGLMLIIALLAPLALGGWTFALKMKWDRLDPITGTDQISGCRRRSRDPALAVGAGAVASESGTPGARAGPHR